LKESLRRLENLLNCCYFIYCTVWGEKPRKRRNFRTPFRFIIWEQSLKTRYSHNNDNW